MRIVRGIIMAALVAGSAQATENQAAQSPAAQGQAAQSPTAESVEKVTFTNKLIDGKKTWTPAELTVKGGGKIEFTLVNELDDPHGFSVPGVTEEIVVKGKETKSVTVAAPKAGAYKVRCQMHPAHVGASITVQ